MIYLDIMILFIVFYGGYHGYQKGFISQFFTFFIFLIFFYKGIFIYKYFIKVLKHIHIFENNALLFMIYSAFISFFSVIIFSFFTKKIIQCIMNVLCIQPIDKCIGGILGMVKYFLYVSICFFVIQEMNQKMNLIPKHLLNNSFEKEIEFLLYKKGSFFDRYNEYKSKIKNEL
ncbi:CvpA family protein [Blattabacterium cuenoti]|uniref:CvpA family protein n=1 Tax=Blattabacterium cuenoti TaxID=1653831 RepID=UPI00163BA764|nr:CvpA family protein [Blattabacterium cuenoti]